MPEQPASISLESISASNAQMIIPSAVLTRWASMAARLSTGGVIPSQPAA